MTLNWLRDFFIILSGLSWIVFLIFLAILGYLLYKKIKPIMESVKSISAAVRGTSSYMHNFVAPTVTTAVAIQNIIGLINGFLRIFKKKGEKNG